MKRTPEDIARALPTDVLFTEAGRRRAALRKTHSGGTQGRPKLLRPCPRCGVTLGAVEMRKHKCEKAAE